MMLHVVANVEGKVVPWAVVGISFVASVEHVVLGDEVGRHGVEAHAEKCAHDEIDKSFRSTKIDY